MIGKRRQQQAEESRRGASLKDKASTLVYKKSLGYVCRRSTVELVGKGCLNVRTNKVLPNSTEIHQRC